ncbi:MAG: TRAP transporter large permease [Oscillospiraceae bacterium]|nr:TRAP transporter large permease [Oscillospiraceae bacterium]
MSPALICILVFLLMTCLILIGIPLPISMLSCAFLGITIVSGFDLAVTQFTTSLFTLSHSYNFAVIPLFMVVGTLASVSGMAEGTFVAARKWVGRVRGGLLYSVVIANMIFGACSGMSSAGNIVFSKIALPELKKANYDDTLSIGTITCAGSLSVLIPPSVPILSFSLLAGVSIGQALVCGISTGILFAILMIILIAIIGVVRPKLIPAADKTKVPIVERLKTLTLLLPILALFALIVGGSFAGWFPATVGGAVAMVAILIYCLARRLPLKGIFQGIMEGTSAFANVYLIIVAGQFFSRFVTITGLADAISRAIASVNMAPYLVFCLVFVFYLFCGCFMDCLSIIVITVPVVFPVLTQLGFHELVLVMLLVFAMEIAALTPPVGLGVFYVANATKMPVSQVFRGVVPFFIMDVVLVLLVAAFPQIILWLPRLMGYA